MRSGFNPHKDQKKELSVYIHQVIIPVYIPNQEGYFKDSFTILKLCLISLFKTCQDKTYFTIVNNGSCEEVIDYLDKLFKDGKIHELIHTTNIGKLNAILKGIAGTNFPLVTVSDADVLFLDNWQNETYIVFNTFPKAGFISPSPNSKLLKYNTANILFEKMFSKAMIFKSVKNPFAMQSFADSIGNSTLFNKHNLNKYLTVSKNDVQAVVGGGHFVGTYRGAIFQKLTQSYSDFKLGGDSESDLLDKPVPFQGYWRLSTYDNYAYHMGNTLEDWMLTKVEGLEENSSVYDTPPQLVKVKSYAFVNWFVIKIFSRILFRKPIWRLFLRYKGLTRSEAEEY